MAAAFVAFAVAVVAAAAAVVVEAAEHIAAVVVAFVEESADSSPGWPEVHSETHLNLRVI
jgi:hypothetical protein